MGIAYDNFCLDGEKINRAVRTSPMNCCLILSSPAKSHVNDKLIKTWKSYFINILFIYQDLSNENVRTILVACSVIGERVCQISLALG